MKEALAGILEVHLKSATGLPAADVTFPFPRTPAACLAPLPHAACLYPIDGLLSAPSLFVSRLQCTAALGQQRPLLRYKCWGECTPQRHCAPHPGPHMG
jgi:hypothetical protein